MVAREVISPLKNNCHDHMNQTSLFGMEFAMSGNENPTYEKLLGWIMVINGGNMDWSGLLSSVYFLRSGKSSHHDFNFLVKLLHTMTLMTFSNLLGKQSNVFWRILRSYIILFQDHWFWALVWMNSTKTTSRKSLKNLLSFFCLLPSEWKPWKILGDHLFKLQHDNRRLRYCIICLWIRLQMTI